MEIQLSDKWLGYLCVLIQLCSWQIFFYYFENKWILNLQKSNLHKASGFINRFCFINDVCAINVNGLFEKHFKEIYRAELQLKKENMSSTKASFLDMTYNHGNNNCGQSRNYSSFALKSPPLPHYSMLERLRTLGQIPNHATLRIGVGRENWLILVYLIINRSFGHIFLPWL